jgi:hypothetical protein
MLKNKRIYRWFVVLTVFFGWGVFLASLATSISTAKVQAMDHGSKLYFDREILPDNLLYPILAAVDRLELELASGEDQIVLRLDFANKRLGAAEALLARGKAELALVTLEKAHQYLLRANEQVRAMQDREQFEDFVAAMDQQFVEEYEAWKFRVSDSQRAKLDIMIVEMIDAEHKL